MSSKVTKYFMLGSLKKLSLRLFTISNTKLVLLLMMFCVRRKVISGQQQSNFENLPNRKFQSSNRYLVSAFNAHQAEPPWNQLNPYTNYPLVN